MTALAAAPLPPLGAPQWAIDMENRITQRMEWGFRVHDIHLHNSEVAQREQSEWNLSRFLNASCTHDGEPLAPLPLPLPRIAVPAIPPPPVPGTAANHPPPWAPPAIVVPAADPAFPANKGALRAMSGPALDTLLQSYRLPGVNVGTVADRRTRFAHHIGVTL
ncbi:hypothetical protein BDZ89DRAFT_1071086 [Hymenopellis radicata]|nr:hypothetical protein BDZ89DRAFT_1071086 [Hymenopellis radicata]